MSLRGSPGEVTDDGLLVVTDGAEEVARVPVDLLTDGAPVRRLLGRPPAQQPALVDMDCLIAFGKQEDWPKEEMQFLVEFLKEFGVGQV